MNGSLASTEGHEPSARTLDECLALDALVLRAHTEAAGDAFDATAHRAQLEASAQVSVFRAVRREGRLVAYAMLREEADAAHAPGCFVTAFNIAPGHRSASVLRELVWALAAHLDAAGARHLRSHVYKTNRASMAFHRRLGFHVTRENDKGVEFVAGLDSLRAHAVLGRLVARTALVGPSPPALFPSSRLQAVQHV